MITLFESIQPVMDCAVPISVVNATSSAIVPAGGSTGLLSFTDHLDVVEESLGLFLRVPAPVGATSGQHGYDFILFTDDDPRWSMPRSITIAQFRVPHTSEFWFNGFYLEHPAPVVAIPRAELQIPFFKGMRFQRHVMALRLVYFNNTNVSQTGERSQRLYVQRRPLASPRPTQ